MSSAKEWTADRIFFVRNLMLEFKIDVHAYGEGEVWGFQPMKDDSLHFPKDVWEWIEPLLVELRDRRFADKVRGKLSFGMKKQ